MKKYVAYITSIIRQVFWFCLPWIVGFYILDILEINTLSAKQILFIYMLWVIHPMVKNFILGIKSRKNYTNFSFNDGFHDAIANELMRIQFKLNQLVNNTYPCFETPKEMRNHPMTMMDFRMFVEYWQAYSAYPEIAACELLEGHEDTQNKHTLYLLAENTQLEKNGIYLSCVDGKIAYSMIAVYDTPVCNVVTDIESPQEFNLTHLNELKSEIIWFVLRQGHFPFPSIIFLKKTDGLKYYDPLQDIHSRNISAQDLINLNSGGPLNYKKTPIKIGFMLQAYIYDADNLGFLRPDQSEIKVISIESEDYVEMGSIISCTIEIQPISGGHCFPYSGEKRGEPVIKTIKYANL